ncbi:NAD-dependent epimerase/dehydratase family protein [Knoellia sp. 3-2P3]|uniref:NAD-dependent epimerase/dehydratase family protein n=1 Tax=unclassified Knoellia TaxID=2618719 RepID=UPI0023DCE7C1|nr:NAD-dependent epimerase/dehydratase family protein [Knoellia sp. 3-2P3]MDF2090977.1 NAD-dependent epimerase/dehydratase family protein [Knoellia sp. 3-2P3]
MVTGGTGFVGSHTVAALHRAGHDIRLLVRRPEQVPLTFAPHGWAPDDLVLGDVRDHFAVARALQGVDAVVHAAAVFSLDTRRADEVARTNEAATATVLTAAVERGLAPVVHMSSVVALIGGRGGGPDLALGELDLPYATSKRRSEQLARGLQDAGAPVVCIYPGACIGPHDPYLGEQMNRLRWLLRGLFPIWAEGELHHTDVRTVAEVVAAVLGSGRRQGRYVVPGHPLGGPELFETLSRLTGRRLPHVDLPARVVLPFTRALDGAQRHLPPAWRFPADHEATATLVADAHFDDSTARAELGVQAPPLEETLRDCVVWLAEAGHISRRQAGRVLSAR